MVKEFFKEFGKVIMNSLLLGLGIIATVLGLDDLSKRLKRNHNAD